MIIYQVNQKELRQLKDAGIRHLVLESQNYGQEDEFWYNIIVSLNQREAFVDMGIGRQIEDKGRSVGFWQNLGGEGIYAPKSVILQGFSAKLTKLLAEQPEAKISFSGGSWEEILRSMPIRQSQKDEFLGIVMKLDKSSKSRKKRHSK